MVNVQIHHMTSSNVDVELVKIPDNLKPSETIQAQQNYPKTNILNLQKRMGPVTQLNNKKKNCSLKTLLLLHNSVVPTPYRKQVLGMEHSAMLSGHKGMT